MNSDSEQKFKIEEQNIIKIIKEALSLNKNLEEQFNNEELIKMVENFKKWFKTENSNYIFTLNKFCEWLNSYLNCKYYKILSSMENIEVGVNQKGEISFWAHK